MLRIAILVLNYNKPHTTLRCVKSVDSALDDSRFFASRKLVIDNGSDIGFKANTVELGNSENRWELVSLDKNLGFAGGMNHGLAHLEPDYFDYYLFLNNDTEVERTALQKVAQYLIASPEKVLTGFHIKDLRTRKTVTIGGYRYYPWLGMARPNKRPPTTLNRLPISYVDGCAFLVRGDFMANQGRLPSKNFMYFEELYLARAIDSSSELGYCNEAVVYHGGGITAKEHPSSYEHHRLAMEACLRFTKDHHLKQLPSVLLVRLAWLATVSVRRMSLGPILAGLSALQNVISESRGP